MVFDIEQFSSALCLAHATYQDYKDLPPQCFVLTDNSKYVLSVILKLGKIFVKEIEEIVKIVSVPEVSDSDDSFLEATLTRYIGMSLNPTYFNFLLVCSLVGRTISLMFKDEECFYKAKLSSIGLYIVYNRCYKNFFEIKEKSQSLGSYCKSLDARLLSEDGRSRLPTTFQEQISRFLTFLKDFKCENFSLSEEEKELLNDIIDLSPPEGKTYYHKNESCESESSIDEGSVEEAMGSLSLDNHDDSKEYSECIICNGKCYKFLELYRQEVSLKRQYPCSKKSLPAPIRI